MCVGGGGACECVSMQKQCGQEYTNTRTQGESERETGNFISANKCRNGVILVGLISKHVFRGAEKSSLW